MERARWREIERQRESFYVKTIMLFFCGHEMGGEGGMAGERQIERGERERKRESEREMICVASKLYSHF